MKEAGYLNKKSAYQDAILEALLYREEIDERNQFVRDFNTLIETLYKFLHPKDYENWKRGKDMIREEEGVDEVIYEGESEKAFRQLKEMGIFDSDKFYAALSDDWEDE